MKSPYSESQIAAILKQAEGGTPVQKVCCEHGISHVTFYRWRRKFGKPNAEAVAKPENQTNQPSKGSDTGTVDRAATAQTAEAVAA